MDVLSEVLKVVKLQGAIFYNAEFSAPWTMHTPSSIEVGPQLAPGAGTVVLFHLITDGCAYAHLDGTRRVPLAAGDLVIFPHGDSHVIANGKLTAPLNSPQDLAQILSQKLKLLRRGGGGDVTRFVCGFLTFESQLSDVLLRSFPPILKVNIRSDAGGQWLENSIQFAVGEAAAARPGADAMLARLSEVLFVEAVRRYINDLPAEETGWLAGVRNPEVGKALALIHREPTNEWTIASLASKVGTSRSVLAERFRHYLGEPPMTYLTRWRLLLGARLLTSGNSSVAEIAEDVGYESEPAFSRAFKREFGVPPARFRTESRTPRNPPTKAAV